MARKILFYTHAFGGGGAEVVFARLADAFAAAGDAVVFAADHAGPDAVVDRPNLRHELLGPRHGSATLRLARLLGAEAPDASFSALGAHNLKHVAAALLAGRLSRCVLGFHGFAVAEARPLARACYWLCPLVTRLAARTVCVSDALLVDMRRRWGASPARTLRIHNPVPSVEASAGARDDPPLIVACGRLVPGKRFPDLVEALARVTPGDARLAILGAGPARAGIAEAARRLGLADRVLLPGHVADPAPWYRRAACLAVASSSESFGLTVAEALSHGTPVVSTACGGPVEILENGRLGRLVPVGDVAALAAALSATLAAPGPEAPRRRRGRDFALASVHRAYADLVDSLSPGADVMGERP